MFITTKNNINVCLDKLNYVADTMAKCQGNKFRYATTKTKIRYAQGVGIHILGARTIDFGKPPYY